MNMAKLKKSERERATKEIKNAYFLTQLLKIQKLMHRFNINTATRCMYSNTCHKIAIIMHFSLTSPYTTTYMHIIPFHMQGGMTCVFLLSEEPLLKSWEIKFQWHLIHSLTLLSESWLNVKVDSDEYVTRKFNSLRSVFKLVFLLAVLNCMLYFSNLI